MRLNYEVPERAPTTIQLATTADRLTLTFPLSPAWPRHAATAGAFAIAALYIAGLAWIAWRDRAPVPNTSALPHATAICLSLAALWAVVGAFALRASRQTPTSHLPRTLIVDAVTRTLTFRAERSANWRHWPLPAFRDISIYPERPLFRRDRGTYVVIFLKGFGSPAIRLCFPSRATVIADEFISELRRLLPADPARESG